jgi:hypothetical protein
MEPMRQEEALRRRGWEGCFVGFEYHDLREREQAFEKAERTRKEPESTPAKYFGGSIRALVWLYRITRRSDPVLSSRS